MTSYSVNYWGSKPGTNDDCWTGFDFDTLAEAEAKYAAVPSYENNPSMSCADVAFIELESSNGMSKERVNPDYVPTTVSDDDWAREIQMQAGMGLGIQAFNDHA